MSTGVGHRPLPRHLSPACSRRESRHQRATCTTYALLACIDDQIRHRLRRRLCGDPTVLYCTVGAPSHAAVQRRHLSSRPNLAGCSAGTSINQPLIPRLSWLSWLPSITLYVHIHTPETTPGHPPHSGASQAAVLTQADSFPQCLPQHRGPKAQPLCVTSSFREQRRRSRMVDIP